MARVRDRLERVWRWRQASVWAPVLWFPALVAALLCDRTALALAVGFAGILFAGLTRLVVWLGRCPRCAHRYRESSEGFRRVWDAAACASCGLSLFELRRGGPIDRLGGRRSPRTTSPVRTEPP